MTDHGANPREWALPGELARPLAALRRRVRVYLLLDGLVKFLALLTATGLAQLQLDRWLVFGMEERVVVNLIITGLWLWGIERLIVNPLLRPLPDVLLARLVDRRHPHLHGQLAAAVQFTLPRRDASREDSPQLIRALLMQAAEATRGLDFAGALNHRRARRQGLATVALAAIPLLAWVLLPGLMDTWFRRNWLLSDLRWPRQTQLLPVGFDERGIRRMPLGEPAVVRAENLGVVPRSVVLEWTNAAGRSGRESMTRVGGRYWEASLGALSDEITFRLDGGDEHTAAFRVLPVERPRVAQLSAEIQLPAYTGLPPATLEPSSAVELLAGSRLVMQLRLNKPVVSARMLSGDAPPGDLEPIEPLALRWTLLASASGSYALELTDADGLSNPRALEYRIKVVSDGPPRVQLELSGVGPAITPRARLTGTLRAEDAYGLADVGLRMQRNRDPELAVPLPRDDPRALRIERPLAFAAREAHISAGDRLKLWAEASDRLPDVPNVGRSPPVDVSVVTPAELLEQLAQREQELRLELERLLSAQRSLADALERLRPELAAPGAAEASLAQRLARLARQQDGHARQCRNAARSFEQIVGEMQTNDVLRVADERRLRDRVIGPLIVLAERTVPAAVEQLQSLRATIAPGAAESTAAAQAQIVLRMTEILAGMRQQEGFREAVAMFEEIVATQQGLQRETTASLEAELEAILGETGDNTGRPGESTP